MQKNSVRSFLSTLVIVAFVAGAFMPASAIAKTLRWKMSTTWTPSIALIDADRHFAETVNLLAKDRLKIKFFDGGSLVPPFQIFEAVQKGTLDAGGDWPSYWSGKNTAFDLLGSYPNGLSAIDYMTWIYQAGGFEIYQEIYGKFGMVYLPYGITPMESGIRGNKQVKSLADYKGMKIRMSGRTQGKILQEMGASQVMISGGEVYQALEKGVIDAGEFCSPTIDWGMGFQEVSKYWTAPGWHQPSTILGVMINIKAWDALGPDLQALLKNAAQANMIWAFTHYDYDNIAGTKNFLDKGITPDRLSEADLAKIAEMANRYTLESAEANPLFAKAAYSMFKYMADIAQWRGISAPYGYGRNIVLPDLEQIKKHIK
jgi:TRAP-type mannitol/chloroaromatic compound transport system substrate-binding protein